MHPLALSGGWAPRFCRALLAAEWLACFGAGSCQRADFAKTAAAIQTSRMALEVLIEGLVDEDTRVRCLSEAWLGLSPAAIRAACCSSNAAAGDAWLWEATAYLDGVLKGPTTTADDSHYSVRHTEQDAAAAAQEYSFLPGGSRRAELTPLQALELSGEEAFISALLQAADAAAACSCCLAPTGGREEQTRRERLLGALRRVRGQARLCLLFQQQSHRGGSLHLRVSKGDSSSTKSSGGCREDRDDMRGVLLISTSLDVDAAGTALRRLCRLRPTKSSRSDFSGGARGQPAALLLDAEWGAPESALQADPIIAQLDPPSRRGHRHAADADSRAASAAENMPAQVAPTAAQAAARGAAETQATASAAAAWGETECAFSGEKMGAVELAASGGSASVASNILLTVRQAIQCIPPLLRAELLIKLLQFNQRRDGGPGISSGSTDIIFLLRQSEGLVVASECLAACIQDYKIQGESAPPPLEAWQLDDFLTALIEMHERLQQPSELQQQRPTQAGVQKSPERRTDAEGASDEPQQSPPVGRGACGCFYCLADEAGDWGPADAPGLSTGDVNSTRISLQVLLWECVARSIKILGALKGPKALAPHMPRVIIPLFEALGSPSHSLSAAARKALQHLHDASGGCPAQQTHRHLTNGVSGAQPPGALSKVRGSATNEVDGGGQCSECCATTNLEERAATVERSAGLATMEDRQTTAFLRTCDGGAKCLLQTEGGLLLDELVCRMRKLPPAALGVAEAEEPRIVCLLSSVVTLAAPSLMGALGSLLTSLLQQHQQWMVQQQKLALEASSESLCDFALGSEALLPPAVPIWLLRVLAVYSFFLASHVITARRASYAARWGPFRCVSCCRSDSAFPLGTLPSSLPRRRICRRGLWAAGSTISCTSGPSIASMGGPEGVALLRQMALLGSNEDGKVLDAPEEAVESGDLAASSSRTRRGRFGALRLQATQVLLCVRHHLRDSRPLAAFYAHLATLRCLHVLSTRERELLPRVHEVNSEPVTVVRLQQVEGLVATVGRQQEVVGAVFTASPAWRRGSSPRPPSEPLRPLPEWAKAVAYLAFSVELDFSDAPPPRPVFSLPAPGC